MNAWMKTLTDTQFVRWHMKVWERMTRDDGYLLFGYDRRTLEIEKPTWVGIIDAFAAEYCRRFMGVAK